MRVAAAAARPAQPLRHTAPSHLPGPLTHWWARRSRVSRQQLRNGGAGLGTPIRGFPRHGRCITTSCPVMRLAAGVPPPADLVPVSAPPSPSRAGVPPTPAARPRGATHHQGATPSRVHPASAGGRRAAGGSRTTFTSQLWNAQLTSLHLQPRSASGRSDGSADGPATCQPRSDRSRGSGKRRPSSKPLLALLRA